MWHLNLFQSTPVLFFSQRSKLLACKLRNQCIEINKVFVSGKIGATSTGSTYNGKWNDWYGPSGRDYAYDAKTVINSSLVARSLSRQGIVLNLSKVQELRDAASVICPSIKPKQRQPRHPTSPDSKNSDDKETPCDPFRAPCLINIIQDPCERVNLASK